MAKLPNYEHTRLTDLVRGLKRELNSLQGSIPDNENTVEQYFERVGQIDSKAASMESILSQLSDTLADIEVGE